MVGGWGGGVEVGVGEAEWLWERRAVEGAFWFVIALFGGGGWLAGWSGVGDVGGGGVRWGGAAFVSGASMANTAALAAARDHQLARAGWDVQADGLFGAPELTVIIGEKAHSTVVKALGLLGLGRDRVRRVPADDQGRMRPDCLPEDVTGPVVICAQAGEVNTGAFDPFPAIGEWARRHQAWMHVDGAFGLWALADPSRGGGVGVRGGGGGGGGGGEVWAVLRTLGRQGVTDLITRTCRHAQAMAACLGQAGLEVVNDVVLNQVLVRAATDDQTRALIGAVQRDGTCWCGPTVWQHRPAMRISVCGWATTAEDITRSADAIIAAAQFLASGGRSG